MGKSKGCQWNTAHFRLLEVCGMAEMYKNDLLSNKVFTKEQFTTSSPLQPLKWQVVRSLSEHANHCGLSSFKYFSFKMQIQLQNAKSPLGKRWGKRLFVGQHQWLKRRRKLMPAKREERKRRWHSIVAVYSLHLQQPSSPRASLSLEGGSVTWRGKMQGKQLIWNSSEVELWLFAIFFF